MSVTKIWDVEVLAASSLVHGGQTQATTTLFRRELLPQPGGGFDQVPLISGNAFRSALRRLGAELFCDALDLEGQLSAAAAAVMINGGALAKGKATALTGARRAEVRTWIIPLGLFGGAANGVLIDGCVRASKLVPVCMETSLVTGRSSDVSIYDLLQVEDYSHTGSPDDSDEGSSASPMRYSLEVLAAGTHLTGSVQLDRGTALQDAFLTSVLDVWAQRGTIGGRVGSGHGQITATLDAHLVRGQQQSPICWRSVLEDHRAQVLAALEVLA